MQKPRHVIHSLIFLTTLLISIELSAVVCLELGWSSGELSAIAIVGFQFGLYHVVAPLSFLRIISLASLSSTNVAW